MLVQASAADAKKIEKEIFIFFYPYTSAAAARQQRRNA
jgi:hypothetical protein